MNPEEINKGLAENARALLERHTAYHEAGHAVVALRLGRTLKAVSLEHRHVVLDDPRMQTIMSRRDALSADDDRYVLENVKIALAGYEAEVVGLGVGHPGSPTTDITRANKALARIGPRPSSGFDLQADVSRMLQESKPALDRIAAALLTDRNLAPEKVQALM